MSADALGISGLVKAFGSNQVLRGVDLTLPAGRVTVLMGANGAGKSTLVKVLCGVHAADGGSMTLDGRPFAPRSASEALGAGVVTVHQSINDGVVGSLDVASNLLLDRLAKGAGTFLNTRQMRAEAKVIADAVGLDVPMHREVSALTLADRQLVSIARAMSHDPRLLVLDEPTSSLSAKEADRLFGLIDRLRDRGVAILYISHRMNDIRRLADRIVSMRDGVISGRFEGPKLDYSGAVRAMLGHDLAEVNILSPVPGKPVFQARGMVLRPGARAFDMTCRENEVVAVVGLVGSGKAALAGAIFGTHPLQGGEMLVDGQPYAPNGCAQAIARGVFMAARDRHDNAVVPDFDIARNLTVPFTRRHSGVLHLLSPKSEAAVARRMVETMGVVCQSPRDNILTLSGGNQQKVVVGRWMAEACRLLILDEPFQGVDIKARQDIGRRIREGAASRATLVLCAELDEALEVADRLLVLSEHSIVGSHDNHNIDVAAIMAEVVAGPQSAAAAPPPDDGPRTAGGWA